MATVVRKYPNGFEENLVLVAAKKGVTKDGDLFVVDENVFIVTTAAGVRIAVSKIDKPDFFSAVASCGLNISVPQDEIDQLNSGALVI